MIRTHIRLSEWRIKHIVLVILLPGLLSCSTYENNGKENPLARVGDNYLYPSDLPEAMANGLSPGDSVSITETYIQNWVKKQLLLEKAELNLLESQQREIEKQLDDTRASLIIYEYEKEMINQKLDTIVTESEIEAYYNENSSHFVLDENIVKALFVKIPMDAPYISRVRNWYKSDLHEDLTDLESYCYQFAEKYDYFNEDWIYFKSLLKELPVVVNDQERYLRYNSNIEHSDSLFHYFVNIREYRLKSTTAPIEFIADNIKTIILNNRKIQFLKELENSIYNDALNREVFEIF